MHGELAHVSTCTGAAYEIGVYLCVNIRQNNAKLDYTSGTIDDKVATSAISTFKLNSTKLIQ